MNLKNYANGKLTLKEIEVFMLGLLKNRKGFLKESPEAQENIIQETFNQLLDLFKNFEFAFSIDNVLSNKSKYIKTLETNSIDKLSFENIKHYVKTIKQIKNRALKTRAKKEVYDSGENRIELDKTSFLKKLESVFEQIPIDFNKKDWTKKSKTKNTLEVPLSDLNLETFYYQDNLKAGFNLIQSVIEKVIEKQVSSDNKYKAVNLFFLGNIINRKLTKEQDFQTSLQNYNLMFEFSLFILKAYFILKEYFPEVHYTFSLEQANFRELELQKEHFSNYNINFERIIPKLLKSKLIDYKLESTIHDFGEESFYNVTTYGNSGKKITISYGDYKTAGKNYVKSLSLDEMEKKLIKEDKLEFRDSRIYIGSKDLFLNTDGHRDLRVCPSIYHLAETNQLFPLFDVDQEGIEISKIWFKLSTANNKLNIYNVDSKEDIQFYDFIKETTLSNKRDPRFLINL